MLLNFGKYALEKGEVPGLVFEHTLERFSVEELSDALIVIGYYKMISIYVQIFQLPVDPQEDGSWIKRKELIQVNRLG